MCIYYNDYEESSEDDTARAPTNETTSADEAANQTIGGMLSRIKESVIKHAKH